LFLFESRGKESDARAKSYRNFQTTTPTNVQNARATNTTMTMALSTPATVRFVSGAYALSGTQVLSEISLMGMILPRTI
jgi:hypothetical protein